jgi:tRNA nucleotidyltransferase/poly(A) polymerase
MTDIIPDEVLDIYKKIAGSGLEAYFVGGSVRDLILNRKIKDWDITLKSISKRILRQPIWDRWNSCKNCQRRTHC